MFGKLSVDEMIRSGILEAYAREQLGASEMSEIETRLCFDLELGECLEGIFITLEQSGWSPDND